MSVGLAGALSLGRSLCDPGRSGELAAGEKTRGAELGTGRKQPTGLVWFGLRGSSAFLEESSTNKKNEDSHDVEVATELVKYGAVKVIKMYEGSKMFDAVQLVMNDETKCRMYEMGHNLMLMLLTSTPCSLLSVVDCD
jgi:hypothetical protein